MTAAGAPVLAPAALWVTENAASTAQVTAPDPALVYNWTITGGTFTGAAQGPAVTFTAGPAAAGYAVVLTCTATNNAGVVSPAGSTAVGIARLPVIPAIVVPAQYPVGTQVTLHVAGALPDLLYRWNAVGGLFSNGTAQAYGAAVTLDGQALGQVQLTCTAINQAGATSAAAPGVTQGVPANTRPVITVQTLATSGQGNITATATAPAGSTLLWRIFGGTFAGGQTTSVSQTVFLDARPRASACCCARASAQPESAPAGRGGHRLHRSSRHHRPGRNLRRPALCGAARPRSPPPSRAARASWTMASARSSAAFPTSCPTSPGARASR